MTIGDNRWIWLMKLFTTRYQLKCYGYHIINESVNNAILFLPSFYILSMNNLSVNNPQLKENKLMKKKIACEVLSHACRTKLLNWSTCRVLTLFWAHFNIPETRNLSKSGNPGIRCCETSASDRGALKLNRSGKAEDDFLIRKSEESNGTPLKRERRLRKTWDP